jgi:hypothetical protein
MCSFILFEVWTGVGGERDIVGNGIEAKGVMFTDVLDGRGWESAETF